jgi:hypothetical protein
MRITFKALDSKMASREKLFRAAVEFANKIDRKDLITITHSEDRDNIVITVWYWTDEPDKTAEIKAKRSADLARAMGSEEPEAPAAGRSSAEQASRSRRETDINVPQIRPPLGLEKDPDRE